MNSVANKRPFVKPRKMFKRMVDEVGGPIQSSSAASEPRNLQQIYNVRKSKTAGKYVDDFTHLLSQVKESEFVNDRLLMALPYSTSSPQKNNSKICMNTFVPIPYVFSFFYRLYIKRRQFVRYKYLLQKFQNCPCRRSL